MSEPKHMRRRAHLALARLRRAIWTTFAHESGAYGVAARSSERSELVQLAFANCSQKVYKKFTICLQKVHKKFTILGKKFFQKIFKNLLDKFAKM